MRALVLAAVLLVTPAPAAVTPPAAYASDPEAEFDPVAAAGLSTDSLAPVVRAAFAAAHRGFSVDVLLSDDELLHAFDRRVTDALDRAPAASGPPPGDAAPRVFAARWQLLRLRKTGRLNVPTTARRRADPDAPPRAAYAPAAEVAARLTQDRFGGSLDAVLCDPPRRAHFDAEAARLAAVVAGVTPAALRRTALALRKTRRLRPELTARIADWGRVVTVHRAADLIAAPEHIPTAPGVYLFRDPTGYLYIGEAGNLRVRLRQHLTGDGQPTLAAHLNAADPAGLTVEVHAFEPQSNARLAAHRRAYESELIYTRQPRFNVRP